MTLAEKVREAAQDVMAATEAPLSDTLNRFVEAFIGWPFAVRPAIIEGLDGSRSAPFAAVVYMVPGGGAVPDVGPVPADRAAALIDACEALTVDSLRASYGRIAQAKQLRKRALPKVKGAGGNTATLGIVLAVRSDLTLEAIAEEMRRLNEQTPGHERPDIVVVASTGLVQYSAQFPGENVSGDFILPGETLSYTPPMYILMVMKPTGTFTLNRMLSFLVGHLATFSPGSKLPRFPDLVEGIPNNAVTLTGYQYNLAGNLVPVPRQFYNDRYLAPRPVTIEDGRGNVLATVQFLPWQDGGVILLRGKFPMEMLLVLLGPVAAGAGFVKRPGAQISYAIPITPADFGRMLERLHRQSNLLVRPDETEWVVKKLSDEGSQSPFTARILAGILRLRDAALSEGAERDGFDKAYDSVITPLRDARARMRRIAELWESHARRVQSGEIAQVQGRAIHVDENVDKDLGQETDAFLSAATRALKTGMRSVAAELGVNIAPKIAGGGATGRDVRVHYGLAHRQRGLAAAMAAG